LSGTFVSQFEQVGMVIGVWGFNAYFVFINGGV